jgi:hypothetical protein
LGIIKHRLQDSWPACQKRYGSRSDSRAPVNPPARYTSPDPHSKLKLAISLHMKIPQQLSLI